MTMLEEHQGDGKQRGVCALCHLLNMSFLHHGRPITFKLLRNTSRVPAMIGVFMPFQQYTVHPPPTSHWLAGAQICPELSWEIQIALLRWNQKRHA